MSAFPAQLYVVVHESDDPDGARWFEVAEDLDALDANTEDGEPIAVYELKTRGRLNLTREFVEDAP